MVKTEEFTHQGVKYKKMETKNGIKWMKEGKFISEKNIPEEVKTAKPEEEKKGAEVKTCLFCNQLGTEERTVALSGTEERKTIYLCRDHYEYKTLGEIVERIRKEKI